jgi:DNA-binding MarR family transcriptional regulator
MSWGSDCDTAKSTALILGVIYRGTCLKAILGVTVTIVMAEHHTIIRQAYESKLLKGPQLVLMLLANRRKEGWKLSDIAAATGFSASLVNMIKVDLIKKGMATEHYPTRDLRVVRLYLTDAGRENAAAMWKALVDLAEISVSWRNSAPPSDCS